MNRLALALVIGTFLASANGCSSTEADSAPTCVAYEPPTAAGAKVTRAEVDTIVERSCSFSSCHGVAPGGGKLWLPKKADGDWRAQVLDKPSVRHPTMKLVTAGDPKNSFFVQKLEGGLCALNAQCTNGKCGDRMPQGGDPLPGDEIAKVVNWVKQGALAE